MLQGIRALSEGGTLVFDSPDSLAGPDAQSGDCIAVPDAHLLFNGDFQRVGSADLKIVGTDGKSFFIEGYFDTHKRAHLMSPEGALLTADIVQALAGPLAPGQYAQAATQATTQPAIGRVDALTGSATVVRNGVSVALNVGDTVRKGDVVQTSGNSSVAIVFTDGSTFSLSANARMVLDDFVYSAGGGNNSALISLVQGTFSFVAGQVAKNGDMRVETPVATMGIRGTAVLVEISANDGQTKFSVMVEPDGTTGSFNLYNKTTGALIATVNNSQVGWVVTPAGPLQVLAQQVQKTPAELQQELAIVQQIFTIFNQGQQNPFVPQQDQSDPDRRGDNPNDPNPQNAQGPGSSTSFDLVLNGGNQGGAAPDNSPTVVTVTITPVGSNPPGNPSGDIPPVNTDAPTDATEQPPPSPPAAQNDSASMTENEVLFVDVLANDYEGVQDGKQIVLLGTPTITGPDGVTLGNPAIVIENNQIRITPGTAFDALAEGETATITIPYIMDTTGGDSEAALATITVNGTNDAPTAVSDSAFVQAGDSVKINVLANDSDVDGDALAVTGVGAPLHGSATILDDGTVLYTPDEGFSGTDSFTYTIGDPSNASATGHVSIVVGRADHVQVGGDVFLQGNFMEIGVSGSGSLGTANPAPAGYHPQGFTGISYVVDIDGWDTGNPPTAGDFTLPGTPEDSIVVGHDGRNFANDERVNVRAISTTTTDTSANGRLQATTIGLTATGLMLTQVIDLDPNATYYKTTIVLENTSDSVMNDVRFMRSFDPDQDVARYGSFYTHNDILANPGPGSDLAIVQAFGPQSGVSVNLIAFDDSARGSNFGFTNHDVYSPLAYSSPQDRNGALHDEAISLTFSAGDLLSGQQATFVFYTSLNGDQGGNDMRVGTSGNDVLNGRGGDDVIIGLGGDDWLIGGPGDDRFIFSKGMGNDTIEDFFAGAGTDDVIELRGFQGLTFEHLLAQTTYDGHDTTIELSADDSLKLVGVDLAYLHKDDFIFAA